MSGPINSTADESNPFWRRWIAGTTTADEESTHNSNDLASEHQDNGWLSRYTPSWFFTNESLEINESTSYHQLTKKQIKILENESEQSILKGHDTWCWFSETLNHKELGSSGVLSVYNTGSGSCPLLLSKFPLLPPHKSVKINVKNSLLIPDVSPVAYMHELPLKTKLAHAIKNHYNYPGEKHLYLKEHPNQSFEEDVIIVISLHGSLPDKYERRSTGKLPTALELNETMLKTLQNFEPQKVFTFSIECPLDVKPTSKSLEESVSLLKNWLHLFQDATRIFVIGTYHTVPLAVLLTDVILSEFKVTQLKSIGILGIESCIQGYQFWNHSAETTPQTMENPTFQLNKEKALFEGSSKLQQEVLTAFRNYRFADGPERKQFVRVLDKLLFLYPNLRLSLVGKLYDNFLTVSQKLALDYYHPSIQRRIWCDGNHMNLDYINLAKTIPKETVDNIGRIFSVCVPTERAFEIEIMNDILLAINLGHKQFVPFLNEMSPFFISRSFNSSTCPALLKKQIQAELKTWLQEKDTQWKELDSNNEKFLPKEIATYFDAYEYLNYKSHKSPDEIELSTSIFSDTSVFEGFIYDNTLAANLQAAAHLMTSNCGDDKVLNSVNEYNLVWKFHEAMGSFLKVTNLPTLPKNLAITTHIEIADSQSRLTPSPKAYFSKTNRESAERIDLLWKTYQTWDPSTTGLRKLHEIFSVLRLYDSGKQLQHDVSIG
ncbi:unnamed protein product [Kluyveromyces dobzhanskii CBS 2104]|uniref:WGS project CCBQ000000000 data, contig 00106 n=1 Tax=Kluyveromyces dobzhanskii CBS 2104 TaxID=1427455 RepID=A0A0A8L531_9SACH|nr:unnamed protein product [Kluyveromyces dobzhanskii CBS 2104]